jgi:hypothetical protein
MLPSPRQPHIPPSIFGFLAAPIGVFYWGVSALLVPYLLRRHGVPVDPIAAVVAIASIPNVWSFLTSPVIDLGLRRRTWLALFFFCSPAGSGALTNLITAVILFVVARHAIRHWPHLTGRPGLAVAQASRNYTPAWPATLDRPSKPKFQHPPNAISLI